MFTPRTAGEPGARPAAGRGVSDLGAPPPLAGSLPELTAGDGLSWGRGRRATSRSAAGGLQPGGPGPDAPRAGRGPGADVTAATQLLAPPPRGASSSSGPITDPLLGHAPAQLQS